MNPKKLTRDIVDGWIALDKPTGLTSTQAVSRLKRVYNGKKAGHAGTLDPLASGILPVAFGEATKTVPFVQDSEKAYQFTVCWGAETDTDDSDGLITLTSLKRPARDEIETEILNFIGDIQQVPPQFSAIKVSGARAYDLAREGGTFELASRQVRVHSLVLLDFAPSEARFSMACGKGAYVRAIARDIGRQLGCLGHITSLRRTRVGPFVESDAYTLDEIENKNMAHEALLSVDAGLSSLPCVKVDRDTAARLRRGGAVVLRGHDAPDSGVVYAACGGVPVAFGEIIDGALAPSRVFNLPF